MMAEWHFIMIITAMTYVCSADKIEVIEESGCPDTEFRLTCANLDSLIAVLSAGLYPLSGNPSLDNSVQVDVNSSGSNSYQCPRNYTAKLHRDLTEWIASESERTKEKDFRNLRAVLNNRCSGKNHCSFKLYEDHLNSEQWGPGRIRIAYACMTASSISRRCSASLTRPSGFIMSPGYPGYYVGGVSCSWTISPPPGLHVQLSLLDVSIRDIAYEESFCMDSLTVTDHTIDRHLVHTCGEKESIATVTSQGHQKMTVTFKTQSKTLYPKRGFLIYYKVLGCQLPTLPKNVKIITTSPPNSMHHAKSADVAFGGVRLRSGSRQDVVVLPDISQIVYQSVLRHPYATHIRQKKTHGVSPPGHRSSKITHAFQRNARQGAHDGKTRASEEKAKHLSPLALSLALRVVYECLNEGYVFPDTLIKVRDLVCVDGRTWNNTLPDCINVTGNTFETSVNLIEGPDQARAVMSTKEADITFDIVVPTFLICALLVGNAIILFVIYRIKKRNPAISEPEEMRTMNSRSAP